MYFIFNKLYYFLLTLVNQTYIKSCILLYLSSSTTTKPGLNISSFTRIATVFTVTVLAYKK